MNEDIHVTIRRAERAQGIHARATDAAIVALGPAVDAAWLEFQAANSVVQALATTLQEIRDERQAGAPTYIKQYNAARRAILGLQPHAALPPRASTLNTLDDVVSSGTTVDNHLVKEAGVDEQHPIDGQGEAAPTGSPWSLRLLTQFRSHHAVATARQKNEADHAERHDKAVKDRAQKRLVLDEKLREFRDVVKDVYGPTSREYRQLRGWIEPEGKPAQPASATGGAAQTQTQVQTTTTETPESVVK